jgi:hypothetical protein
MRIRWNILIVKVIRVFFIEVKEFLSPLLLYLLLPPIKNTHPHLLCLISCLLTSFFEGLFLFFFLINLFRKLTDRFFDTHLSLKFPSTFPPCLLSLSVQCDPSSN